MNAVDARVVARVVAHIAILMPPSSCRHPHDAILMTPSSRHIVNFDAIVDATVPYNANIDAAVVHIAHFINAISVQQARILRTHQQPTNNLRHGVREEVHHVQP